MDPATNAQFEGFALAPSQAQPTVRQNNVTQISKRDATISGSQEESDAAGKGSEMSHQMAMASKVLKSPTWKPRCAAASRASTATTPDPAARVTEGITHWLGSREGQDAARSAALSRQAPLSPACRRWRRTCFRPRLRVQLTEAMVGDAMQKAYTNGASPTLMVVPPGPKRTVSTFTGRSTTQVLSARLRSCLRLMLLRRTSGASRLSRRGGFRQTSASLSTRTISR